MLVLPADVLVRVVFGLRRRWRRFGDLGNEVRSRSLSDAIKEDSKQWNLYEHEEAHGEPEEHTFSISEPAPLLVLVEANPSEVWFELFAMLAQRCARNAENTYELPHQTSRREVSLQEDH